jgi:hypothetical protein
MPISRYRILAVLFVFFLILGIFSCDFGTFPASTPLHPPLGLVLTSTNAGTILVQFWAFNNEEAFAGYNIFMGSSEAAARDRDDADCLKNINGSLPSINPGRSDDVRLHEINVTNDPSGSLLTSGATWYVTVSAYDGFNYTNSYLGEVKSIAVQ